MISESTRPDDPGAHTLLAADRNVRSVGDLEKGGVEKVRLFSRSQFDTAVRDAVAREILVCLEGLDLSDSARAELEERALTRLSGELAAPPPRPSRAPAAAPEVAAPTPDFDFAGMERRLVDEIGRLVSQNWKDDLRTAQDSQRESIGRLENRIETLMRALEQVERMMDEVPAPGGLPLPIGTVDAPRGGALGGIKNDLLEQLFEANLALRELEAEEEIRGSNADSD